MTQPSLLDYRPPSVPRATSEAAAISIEPSTFAQFHATNPDVYRRLVELARYANGQGKRVGIRLLWERLRWDATFETEAADWKLNNNFTGDYARLIMEEERDLAGYFEVRGRVGQ